MEGISSLSAEGTIMKSRIVIIAVAVIVAAGAGLCFSFRQSPVIEKIVFQVLDGNYSSGAQTELTPELRAFVDWYEPMVSDAPEEVIEVMKRFDPKYRTSRGQRNRELETIVPADEWIMVNNTNKYTCNKTRVKL